MPEKKSAIKKQFIDPKTGKKMVTIRKKKKPEAPAKAPAKSSKAAFVKREIGKGNLKKEGGKLVEAKAKQAPKKKESIADTIENFPFKRKAVQGGRPLGLEESDLYERLGDNGPASTGFKFSTPAQLLKTLSKSAESVRPGGYFHGRLGAESEAQFAIQEKYIKDGKYNPPNGVVARLVSKGKAFTRTNFETPITKAKYLKMKEEEKKAGN